ncbi:hypothetical protein Bca52824_097128 [Brassica carinata]|uniref:KIB1-4 beta-propeller domain-containing protein n=1 Tax=Brassica carinata TaxID=52824 RepID=A0A8X7NXU1_BRACI|nr:hypothetical protein Bca52824_097128 [Brassica carinata]
MSSSLLLNLSSKLTLRKLALRHQTLRMFSSTTTTNPFLVYAKTIYGNPDEDLHVRSDIHYFDPVKEDEVILRDKALPMEFRKECFVVGMSHGWVVFKARDYYSPCGSKSNPKTIPLHPMGQPNPAQQLGVTNAAMTCSPDHSSDFAVAVNCLGPVINFFRPGGKHKDSVKGYVFKRDEKFYTTSVGGQFLVHYDAFFEEDMTGSEVHELRFINQPELTQSEWEILDSCSKTVHLNHQPGKEMTFLCRGTKRFMVFREEEETRIMSYTEDIGDLCIFLGNNEPFCVKASSFPGLIPNSIYFAGDGFGVYDISTRKPRSFRPKSPAAFSTASLASLDPSDISLASSYCPSLVYAKIIMSLICVELCLVFSCTSYYLYFISLNKIMKSKTLMWLK